MQFSYLLTAFLATLAIASPLTANPDDEIAGLAARAPGDTAEFTAALAAHPGLTNGQVVWFSLEWALTVPVGDGDVESKTELQQLQAKLGFDHIGVVAGTVKETTTGKGKNQKTKRDFDAQLFHMIKTNVNPGDTALKTHNWAVVAGQTLKFGGVTTAKKITNAKNAAKAYVEEHKIYAVNGNNCNDFAQTVIRQL